MDKISNAVFFKFLKFYFHNYSEYLSWKELDDEELFIYSTGLTFKQFEKQLDPILNVDIDDDIDESVLVKMTKKNFQQIDEIISPFFLEWQCRRELGKNHPIYIEEYSEYINDESEENEWIIGFRKFINNLNPDDKDELPLQGLIIKYGRAYGIQNIIDEMRDEGGSEGILKDDSEDNVIDIFTDQKLYVIFEKESECYKVGISNNPEVRLKRLQTGNPKKLELILVKDVKNATKIERSIHKKFSEFRLEGEWFSYVNLEEIKQLAS